MLSPRLAAIWLLHRIPERADSRKRAAIWLLAVVLCLLQARLFVEGFRLSGDDVMFFLAAIRGWDDVWTFANLVAVEQGRIGGYFIIPLNALGAYLVEWPVFRWAFVILDFAALALFAIWLERIQPLRIAPLLFSLLIGFHALGFLHLSPTAFPLQNTVPFVLLFSARLALTMEGVRGRFAYRAAAMALFGLAMLASEYGFLVGCAMLALEHGARMARNGPRAALRHRGLRVDAGIVAVVLAIYVAWRMAHPSGYTGNQLVFSDMTAFAITWLGHAGGLLAMPWVFLPAFRHEPLPLSILPAGVLMAGCLLLSPLRYRPADALLLIAGGVFWALLVSFPSSATAPQQHACMTRLACAFLDSRAAYFGTGTAFAGTLLLVASLVPETKARATRLGLAGLIGLCAGIVALNNVHQSHGMSMIAAEWERAALHACLAPEDRAPFVEEGLVPMHPELENTRFYPSREEAWRRYIDWRASLC